MKLAVIQPSWFPSIEQIGKILAADAVIWADSFAFHKHGNINRTRIKTITGPKWLTIPVYSSRISITQVQIDNHEDWQRRHWQSIEINYKNAAYYYQYCDELLHFFELKTNMLGECLKSGFEFIMNKLDFPGKVYYSSELQDVKERSERVVSWCSQTGCNTYIIESFEKSLIDSNLVQNQGINIMEYSLEQFNYFQIYPDFYFPLSVLDILLNEGPESRRNISKNINLSPLVYS